MVYLQIMDSAGVNEALWLVSDCAQVQIGNLLTKGSSMSQTKKKQSSCFEVTSAERGSEFGQSFHLYPKMQRRHVDNKLAP
jgi:hypothetical protein